jgi:voltage-gated potassium channel
MPTAPTDPDLDPRKPWQIALARFFSRAWVEVVVGVLVLISVSFTLVEFALEGYGHDRYATAIFVLTIFNELLTAVFVVELFLRFLAAGSKPRFFREYWIDILAVLPLFRIFRAGRAFRLLRLIRVLRLLGVVNRLSSHFPTIFRRGLREYLAVCAVLLVTVVFSTGAILFFEGTTGNKDGFNLEKSFWFSLYSLFAGEPVGHDPTTLGGKVVAVFIMFMGLTIFAMFTGTVSAFMVERFQHTGSGVNLEDVRDHIVICGWNTKAEIIAQEYALSPITRDMDIVVIAQWDKETPPIPPSLQQRTQFLNDDFTRVVALEAAGIMRAKTCIILSDTSNGRSEQDADARTILAALTVEKLSPNVYTCAELINRSYATHLTMGHVNDYVVSGEYSAFMLAQAAMNRGLMGVVNELLTYKHGNEFYRLAIPKSWHGLRYLDAFLKLKQNHDATLVAVHPHGGEMRVNPKDHEFKERDEIVCIAEDDFVITE